MHLHLSYCKLYRYEMYSTCTNAYSPVALPVVKYLPDQVFLVYCGGGMVGIGRKS